MNRALRPLILCAASLFLVSAQGGARQQSIGQREAMWPAPTAEDWEKPCLVTFQRSWDDALAVARATRKPILICVNMDGEIASEHYAGIRYRQPDKAALYDPYVCVIASVYRHTPRDYDDQGRRIECPRFGSVTCGEHIAIEPVLYEQFFDGRRIAPRHIGVELEQGKAEIYDVYYAFDTDSVFQAIREGSANRPPPLEPGDLPLVERAASHDVKDREAVERAYVQGDRELRRRLITTAVKAQDLDEVDLLRLALFGLDAELARLARAALAESGSEKALDLIVEVLRVPMEPAEREALLAALERLGEQYPRARTLVAVQQGLAEPSASLDAGDWSASLAGAEYPAPAELGTVRARVEDGARRAATAPEDPEARLALAEAALALAVDPQNAESLSSDWRTASDYALLQFEDSLRAAREAEALGASGWRLDTVLALASYYLGDLETAHARAEAAVQALPTGEASWSSMAVLALFAQARERGIWRAMRDGTDWPKEWIADVNATYAVLAEHPLGTEHQVASHHDFLKYLGARERAAAVLDAGLERFPQAWGLHQRLRTQGLEEQGVEGLEAVYAARLAADPRPPGIEWFAGYAALVTAEYYRRAGNPAAAGDAYGRAISHYERAILDDPLCRPNADHYVAMALAGQARLALEHGRLERSVEEIVAAFERKPEAAAVQDGLNLSPVDTAKMLLAQVRESGRADLEQRLQDALDRLDPAALELPAYERDLPGDPARQRRPRAGGGR